MKNNRSNSISTVLVTRNSKRNCWIGTIVIILSLVLATSSIVTGTTVSEKQQQEQQQERRNNEGQQKQQLLIMDNEPIQQIMAGGYTSIDDPSSDERLSDVTKFVIQNFASSPVGKYSFRSEVLTYNQQQQQQEEQNQNSTTTTTKVLTIKVIHAARQVVAGMNYRITMAIYYSPTNINNTKTTTNNVHQQCLGALTVTVYDHFGDLSITTWGDEVKCD